jgi:hypothetical protein
VRFRSVIATAALVAALLGSTSYASAGASQPQSSRSALREAKLLAAAQAQAKAVCAKAKAGTSFDFVTFANGAAGQLLAARMNPAPWNRLSRSQLVFACYGGVSPTAKGVYVDQHGHRTLAPPFPVEKCKRTESGTACPIEGFSESG